MALESATYIDGLVTTNPTGTDNRSQGDDHIRLLKSTIKATFPNINGAVSATDEEIDAAIVTAGTLTASKLVKVDASKKIDNWKVDNIDIDGNTISSTDTNGDINLTPNGTGKVALADTTLSRPKVQDYSEVVNVLGTVSTSTAIDYESGNVVTATLAAGGAFTFTNPPASGTSGSFLLIVTNGGTATTPFPASVKWSAGAVPTLQSSGTDILSFVTTDAGTNWYGFHAGVNMS